MGRGVSQQALQSPSDVKQPLGLLVPLAQLPQVWDRLQGLGQGVAEGNLLSYPIGLFVGEAKHPGHVPHCRTGGKPVEGPDLGQVVLAIAPGGVLDHLVPAPDAKVDVDVGQADPVGVQKALEQQPPLEGVHLGDPQRVGHQGAGGRTPARAHRDPLLPGIADEVRHDQKVGSQAHPANHRELIGQALLHLRGQRGAEPLLCPSPGQMLQILLRGGEPLRHREGGQKLLAKGEFKLTTLGHLQGAVHRPGHFPEPGPEFRFAQEVVAIPVEGPGIRPLQAFPPLDVDQHLVGLPVLRGQVMHVRGGHRGEGELPGEPELGGDEPPAPLQAVVLEFQVKPPREDLGQAPGRLPGLPLLSLEEEPLHFPRLTGRQGHQSLRVPLQKLQVHPGFVVKPLGVSPVHQGQEVLPPHLVLRQHHQVVVIGLSGLGFLQPAGAGGNVEFAAQDRLEPRLPGCPVELHRSGEYPVVGERQGGQALCLGPGHQFRDPASGIQERVLGVNMKVHEGHLPPPSSVIEGLTPDGLPSTGPKFPHGPAQGGSLRTMSLNSSGYPQPRRFLAQASTTSGSVAEASCPSRASISARSCRS